MKSFDSFDNPLIPSPISRVYEDIFRQIKSKSKLVLHFDVNETILIGDDAGGDTV